MKRYSIIPLLLLLSTMAMAQQLPNLSSGKMVRVEKFQSAFVEPRTVDVWLPDGYSTSMRYPVIYMHDGQMLFDSTQTWNRKEWGIDEAVGRLIREKKIPPVIVVAIWNTGANRIPEYLPDKIFNRIDPAMQKEMTSRLMNGKGALADNYLQFMVKELIPFVNKNYPVKEGRENTFVMGSSMGGIISLYALCEYPGVFGGAAALSTAWLSFIKPEYEIPVATFNYLRAALPSPEGHRIYMDYGTGEGDANYRATQSFVDLMVRAKGYGDGSFLSKVYENAIHDEVSWSRRVDVPIEFFFRQK